MKSPRWAKEETHDPERQSLLVATAESIAADIAGDPDVLTVLLTGSVARKPVMRSSDLDMHVIVRNSQPVLPEWWFSNEVIVNVHHVGSAELQRVVRYADNSKLFASWLHRTLLGDEMHGFRRLYADPGHSVIEEAGTIVNRRQDEEVATRIARLFFSDFEAFLSTAERALRAGAAADAHQYLRWGMQKLLVGALVQRGWIIRGSKHQIEIAMAFLPDPELGRILDTAFEVVGLSILSQAEAQNIAELRLGLRNEVLSALEGWKKSNPSATSHVVDFQVRHNAGAFDYYAPLIRANMHRGAVNHIRTISGFPRLPSWFLPLFDARHEWPIHTFMTSPAIDSPLRSTWCEIAALSTSPPEVQSFLNAVRRVSPRG